MELTESRNFPKFGSASQRFQFLQNVPGTATASTEKQFGFLAINGTTTQKWKKLLQDFLNLFCGRMHFCLFVCSSSCAKSATIVDSHTRQVKEFKARSRYFI